MPKRVLFVAYDFPPRRSSAVYRFAGMMKYMHRFGWDVTVLTARPRPGEVLDASLLRDLPPEVEIVRTPNITFHVMEDWLDRRPQAASAEPSSMNPVSHAAAAAPPSRLRKLAAAVRAFLYIPDEMLPWVFAALGGAIRLRQRKAFDLIYTSSPPRSVYLVGFLYKLLFGTRWVCELRDPLY